MLDLELDYFRIMKNCSNEDHFPMYIRWGYYYLTETKEFDKAIAIFTNALALNKVSPLSWLYLGKAYFAMENYEQAEVALTEANIYDPHNVEIWVFLVLSAL